MNAEGHERRYWRCDRAPRPPDAFFVGGDPLFSDAGNNDLTTTLRTSKMAAEVGQEVR